MKKPQHQGSLTDQLIELHALANANGLYDAADYLQSKIKFDEDERDNGIEYDESLDSRIHLSCVYCDPEHNIPCKEHKN